MANQEELTKKISELLITNLKLESTLKLNDDTQIGTLGFNSITIIKLIVEIENEYDIEFDDEQLNFEGINTIRELVSYIDGKMKSIS